jgi:hypothetical protein
MNVLLEHLLHSCKAVSTMCWYIIPRGSTVCVCVIYKPQQWGDLGPIWAVMKGVAGGEEKQVP